MIDSSKNTPSDPTEGHVPKKDGLDRQLLKVSLAELGVVFGDIGTSPLYALRECFHGEYSIAVSPANVLGGSFIDVLVPGDDCNLKVPDIRLQGGQPGGRRSHGTYSTN